VKNHYSGASLAHPSAGCHLEPGVAKCVGRRHAGGMERTNPASLAADPNGRLRTATRIHYLLVRYLGDGIDVRGMLRRDDYAREVLLVCEASDDPELHALARQYRDAPALVADTAAAAPQDAAWARDTSGFGFTPTPALIGEITLPQMRRGARWYDPSSWFTA
jgi:hypothetical protein